MIFPSPLPSWFWVWARWRLGRGEFVEYGPANPAVRPPNAPAQIPNWAWQRLKLLMFGTTLPMGLFASKGAFLRNPRGGVENFVEQARCVTWTACNTGDHTSEEWSYYVSKAKLANIKVIPWARCRNETDVHRLISIAHLWHSLGLIVNLETEAKDVLTPAQVAAILYGYTGQVGISTEAWLYNPPTVNWKPLNNYTVMLQIFPQEAEPGKYPAHCIAHAKELGFEKVTVTYGSHMDGQASWFDLKKPNYSVYTGDDIGVGNWDKWFP